MSPKLPTKAAVLNRLKDYDRMNRETFLAKYAKSHGAQTYYILHDDKEYDLKAVWVAAHQPPVEPKTFNTTQARKALEAIGFAIASPTDAHDFVEGKRRRAEIYFFVRNQKLAEAAKKQHGFRCMACGFDFAKTYGSLGERYIECHHLNPLSERAEIEWDDSVRTSMKAVATLCSNCHRMIHRQRPAISLEGLKEAIQGAKGGM